jgi:hypothetical protein
MTTSGPGRQPLWEPSKDRVAGSRMMDWYVAFAGGRGTRMTVLPGGIPRSAPRLPRRRGREAGTAMLTREAAS